VKELVCDRCEKRSKTASGYMELRVDTHLCDECSMLFWQFVRGEAVPAVMTESSKAR
jgi:hypothetical protein